MPEFPNRVKYLAEHRYDYTAIDVYRGPKMITQSLLRFRSKRQANQISDLLNNAYQVGRQDMMKELRDLAATPGGEFYIGVMLTTGEEMIPNPNEKDDDGNYLLTGDELRAWWDKIFKYLEEDKEQPETVPVNPVTGKPMHTALGIHRVENPDV